MFEYNICNEVDEEIFQKQCSALEKNINGLIKEDLGVDVDGSKIQKYKLEESIITVHNDYYLGCVYVKSEIKLERFFG